FNTPPKTVAGVDSAFIKDKVITACIAMDYYSMRLTEAQIVIAETDFPYIQTFLAFREAACIIEAIKKLETHVNVFLINSHGIAHPRRCGCASHVGVEIGKPTIGVASSRLYGDFAKMPSKEGEAVPLTAEGQQIGWVLRTRESSKPIYISPGHLVSLTTSLNVVKGCLKDHRLPEPLFTAHILANMEKNRLIREGSGHVSR
ncbi:MAG: endonuclease V, partial [Candidatus Bathyarchaeia archaeon]